MANNPFATSVEKTMEQKRDVRPGSGRRGDGAGRNQRQGGQQQSAKPGQRRKPEDEDTGIDTGENNVDETDTEIGDGSAAGQPRSRGRGDRRINR